MIICFTAQDTIQDDSWNVSAVLEYFDSTGLVKLGFFTGVLYHPVSDICTY
jgi:hypothetical protein